MTYEATIPRVGVLAVILLCAACELVLSHGDTEASEFEDPVVARVNGEDIRRSQILWSDEEILRDLRRRKLLGDTTMVAQPDSEQGEAMRSRRAVFALADQIRHILYHQTLLKFEVTETDSEVVARASAILGSMNTDSLLQSARSQYAMLCDALDDYYERGVSKDIAYARHVSGWIERKVWDLWLVWYEDPESRERLRELVKKDWMKVTDSEWSAIEAARMLKMDRIIDAEMAKEDEAYRRFLAGESRGVLRANPGYDWEMRERWWEQRFREADIQILDERYRGALDILFRTSTEEKE